VTRVEGQKSPRDCLLRASGSQGVVRPSAGDPGPWQGRQQRDGCGAVQRDDVRALHEVRLHEGPRIDGREAVRCGQSGQHGVGFGERVCRYSEGLAVIEPPFDFRRGGSVAPQPNSTSSG